jgi:hypothetical protein
MCEGWNNKFFNLVEHAHRLHVYGVWSSGVKRKKLLSVLLSSKMPLVTHQLSVLSRDMFSSMCVYRTYAEISLLARRPLPSSCVERMKHQTQSPRLLLKRQLTLWTFTILNIQCLYVHHYIVMIWYISYVICYMTYKCSNHWCD